MKGKLGFRKYIFLCVVTFVSFVGSAQTEEEAKLPEKVHHIEPLYIDLVRDLGARRGEKELNIGGEFVNTSSYSIYKMLAEYEFAPIDRLGLEIDRKSTRLNSSHVAISYAVFCLK